MKKSITNCGGGLQGYISPDVVLLDFSVERGFAESLPDLDSKDYGDY